MTTNTDTDDRQTTDAERGLRPFRGYFSPGVTFSSGHTIYLYNFQSTPTEIDSYGEFWIVSPDREKTLYVDPERATESVLRYHNFDRTVGADLEWTIDGDSLAVTMDGDDGTEAEFRASLGRTIGTRALDLTTTVTPKFVLRSRLGAAISTASFNLVLDANGVKIAGVTDTGARYRVESDRLATVTAASATVDGTDLGDPTPADRPVHFGDAKVPDEPYVVFGDLNLEHPIDR